MSRVICNIIENLLLHFRPKIIILNGFTQELRPVNCCQIMKIWDVQESVLREIKKSKALEKTSATKSWIGKFRSLNQVLAL